MQTVYIETTIVSYYVSRLSRDILVAARQQMTQQWWDEQRQKYEIYTAAVTLDEAGRGDPETARRRLSLLAGVTILVRVDEISPQADDIAHALNIPTNKINDAVHLAYAMHYGLDYFLTWNCSHFANAATMRRLADYCRQRDLWLPVICTVEEMLGVSGEMP